MFRVWDSMATDCLNLAHLLRNQTVFEPSMVSFTTDIPYQCPLYILVSERHKAGAGR